jgi:uncharacterized protein YqfA (UPF0365 family)
MRASLEPRTAYLLGVATAFGASVAVWLLFRLLGPWLLARAAGAPVSVVQILGMRMRGSDPRAVVGTWNALRQLGEEVPLNELETVYLGLPPTQRDTASLLRAVRPELLKRLEQESRVRQAGGAA